MVIVPSIDVRGGRVAFRGGAGAAIDPRELAERYVAAGAEELHLVDLDGAERGAYDSLPILVDIARTGGARCRLAGGIASVERATAALEAGFSGVLFSSAVFGDPDLVRRCARLPGAIVEIEAKDGKLAPRGGGELAPLAAGMDVARAAAVAALRGSRGLYVIDVGTDGRFTGPPLVLLEQVRREAGPGVALHAGGGVRDLDDVRALATWGAASVVIGRALLEGRFSVREARAACA